MLYKLIVSYIISGWLHSAMSLYAKSSTIQVLHIYRYPYVSNYNSITLSTLLYNNTLLISQKMNATLSIISTSWIVLILE